MRAWKVGRVCICRSQPCSKSGDLLSFSFSIFSFHTQGLCSRFPLPAHSCPLRQDCVEMEGDLLFSCPVTFMECGHAADQYYVNHGALLGVGSAGLFSAGNVLDTVSEDPIAELEDSITRFDADVKSYPAIPKDCLVDPPPVDTLIDEIGNPILPASVSSVPQLSGVDGCEDPLMQFVSRNIQTMAISDANVANMMNVNGGDVVNLMACSDAVVAKLMGINDADVVKMMGVNEVDLGIVAKRCGASAVLAGITAMDTLAPVCEPMTGHLQQIPDCNGLISSSMDYAAVEPFIIAPKESSDTSMVVLCESIPGHLQQIPEELNEPCDGLISSSIGGYGATSAAAEPFFTAPEKSSCLNIRNVDMAWNNDDVDGLAFQQGAVSLFDHQNSALHKRDLGLSIQAPQVQAELPEVRIQRSFSSHALGQLGKRNFLYGPEGVDDAVAAINTLAAPSGLIQTTSVCNSPIARCTQVGDVQHTQSSLPVQAIRRVYSTGDLESKKGTRFVPNATSPSSASYEERAFKIGKYTLEERKSRICRYRQKRNERNFSKTIKYACRKTLADSRPRVRGRFARNDDTDDSLYQPNSVHSYVGGDDEASWQRVQTQWSR